MIPSPLLQQYWEYAYEDILDVIAKMPEVAALIYRCKFKDGVVKKDLSLDYTGNYCTMMGYEDKQFQDLMRLYLVIHSVREVLKLLAGSSTVSLPSLLSGYNYQRIGLEV